MEDRTTGAPRLDALGLHLGAVHGLKAVMTPDGGLWVRNLTVTGCCDEPVADTITCRPRADDRFALWFFTSWGQAIAPAHRLTDAAVIIKGYLSGRPGAAVLAEAAT